MQIINEIETLLAAGKAIQTLAANGQLQTDVAAILADLQKLKVLYDDVKVKIEDAVSKLGPEVQALINQAAPATTVTTTTVSASASGK